MSEPKPYKRRQRPDLYYAPDFYVDQTPSSRTAECKLCHYRCSETRAQNALRAVSRLKAKTRAHALVCPKRQPAAAPPPQET